MEGHDGLPPPELISRFWWPGWNSVQALNKFQSEIAGPLIGGDPGRRLIDSNGKQSAVYFTEIPANERIAENRWRAVALYHVFGSEEMSILSPGIAERMPNPYLAMNPEDAAALRIIAGDPVTVTLDRLRVDLPVRLMPGLSRTVIGVPVGIPGIPVVKLPAAADLKKAQGV
jgi:NADH-quinone oxidoreductase subunit G